MSARVTVVAAPAFAGGPLQTFNRLLLAAARAPDPAAIELAFDEERGGEAEAPLRVLNAHGDPLGLPVPHRGVLRDERERALWRAALLDVMPPTLAGPDAVERFLPRAGASRVEAALELWSILWPGLHVRVLQPGEAAPRASAEPKLVWVGAHQRKALAELGVSAEQMVGGHEGAAARYRPQLQGELADATERLRGALDGPLGELRALAVEVDPTLLGAWSRMERAMRRGVEDFRTAAERCLDNHSSIRRTRWHAVAQALRPADGDQETGLSLLTAVAQFGLQTRRWAEYVEEVRARTSPQPSADRSLLFLEC